MVLKFLDVYFSQPPQIIEKKVLHNLFEEYKSKYIIRRREEVE